MIDVFKIERLIQKIEKKQWFFGGKVCCSSGNSDCFYIIRVNNTIIYLQQISKKSIIFNDLNKLTKFNKTDIGYVYKKYIYIRNPADIIII